MGSWNLESTDRVHSNVHEWIGTRVWVYGVQFRVHDQPLARIGGLEIALPISSHKSYCHNSYENNCYETTHPRLNSINL